MPVPYVISHLGVTSDDEYNSTHKRERLTLWSGPFASQIEGSAVSLPHGDGYMITTYPNGAKLRVTCPTPRDDKNYRAIDQALEAALNEHFAATGAVTLVQS